MKKKSGLYDYLEQTGVLETGTDEDIRQAKKTYWAEVRKQWKRNRRKTSKSYVVFFSPHESKLLKGTAGKQPGGVTQYIKQAAISAVTGKASTNKHFLGQMREALSLHYSAVEQMQEEETLSQKAAEQILQRIVSIENKLQEFI